LVELKDFNKLFYVAHKLVDLYPDESISWYAVDSYYDPARRFLQKAHHTGLSVRPGLAGIWPFICQRERARSGDDGLYFKATQLMRGCHLPLLYIGVECGIAD
jgi:anaphase-promoting complex subunit 6